MTLSQTSTHGVKKRTWMPVGLTISALLILTVPFKAAASSDYETAVSCAGGLAFMSTMLPAGSDPAKEATTRGAAWQAEAQRLSRKGQSRTEADIRSATDETQAVMMSGDQARIAEFFGPLNETCAELPKGEPEETKVENPFNLENPTALDTFNRSIMCAGRYAIEAGSGDDPEAQRRKARFRSYALETLPNAEENYVDEQIQKATTEWMMATLNMEDRTLVIIDICNKGYANLE